MCVEDFEINQKSKGRVREAFRGWATDAFTHQAMESELSPQSDGGITDYYLRE